MGVWGVRGKLGGRELRQLKVHPRCPNTSQHKVLLYLLPFGCNFNVKFWLPPQFDSQFEGLQWTYEVENGANQILVPTFLFDFYTYYRLIYHRLVIIKRGSFQGLLIWGVWGVKGELVGWELRQLKAHPRLPNTCRYKVLLYLRPFGRNSNVKFWPSNLTLTFGRLGCT